MNLKQEKESTRERLVEGAWVLGLIEINVGQELIQKREKGVVLGTVQKYVQIIKETVKL